MGDFGGGIPGQVITELGNITKQAVVDSAKAIGSIATGTAEKIVTGAATSQTNGQVASDPLVAMKARNDAAAKRRLSEVRGELQEYYEREKKKKEQEEEMIEEQKKEEEKQITKSKKKQEEQEVLRRMSGQYGGTGEIGKGGN